MKTLNNYRFPFLKRYFLRNLRDLCFNIKMAWQRSWRGYDLLFLWNTESYIHTLLEIAIKWHRHHGNTFPVNDTIKSVDDWHKILDSMLDDLFVINQEALYSDLYYRDGEFDEEKFNMHQLAVDKATKHLYSLLGEHIFYIWD